MVIQAGATVPVEAFCVEQGRWTSMRLGRATFQQFDVSLAQSFRMVRAKGQYEADQGGVWEEVAKARMKFSAKAEVEISLNESLNLEAMENLQANEGSSSLSVAQDAAIELSGKELDAAAEKSSTAERAEHAEKLKRMVKKHHRRADELERARKEKLNETVLEPLMDMPNDPYVPTIPELTTTVSLSRY